MTLRVISYGGGVQSTALLVLAATDRIDFRTFLHANVGNDSEDPNTITYIRHVAVPYAAATGVDLRILERIPQRGPHAGRPETLYGRLTRENSRSLPIPVRMSNGAPGTRNCTSDFKIRVVGRWLAEHGAGPDDPATVGVGISLDEIHRVNQRKANPYETLAYPLLDHTPPMRRIDCERTILAEPLPHHMADALRSVVDDLPAITRSDLVASDYTRLPRPPKSACWFCPFHRPSTWAEMRRDRPELFERSAQLEDLLNARRADLDRDPVYLTRYNLPLRVAIPAAQQTLFADDTHGADDECDNGMCFT